MHRADLEDGVGQTDALIRIYPGGWIRGLGYMWNSLWVREGAPPFRDIDDRGDETCHGRAYVE